MAELVRDVRVEIIDGRKRLLIDGEEFPHYLAAAGPTVHHGEKDEFSIVYLPLMVHPDGSVQGIPEQERMNQTPTVGRIVHYQSRGSTDGHFMPAPRAAIITEVITSTEPGEDYLGERVEGDRHWSEYANTEVEADRVEQYVVTVSLCVLNPTGMFFDENVEYSETAKPGCWSWPPRA